MSEEDKTEPTRALRLGGDSLVSSVSVSGPV